MFPLMGVPGGVSAGRQFEYPHAEIPRSISPANENSTGRSLYLIAGENLRFRIRVMNDLHRCLSLPCTWVRLEFNGTASLFENAPRDLWVLCSENAHEMDPQGRWELIVEIEIERISLFPGNAFLRACRHGFLYALLAPPL